MRRQRTTTVSRRALLARRCISTLFAVCRSVLALLRAAAATSPAAAAADPVFVHMCQRMETVTAVASHGKVHCHNVTPVRSFLTLLSLQSRQSQFIRVLARAAQGVVSSALAPRCRKRTVGIIIHEVQGPKVFLFYFGASAQSARSGDLSLGSRFVA